MVQSTYQIILSIMTFMFITQSVFAQPLPQEASSGHHERVFLESLLTLSSEKISVQEKQKRTESLIRDYAHKTELAGSSFRLVEAMREMGLKSDAEAEELKSRLSQLRFELSGIRNMAPAQREAHIAGVIERAFPYTPSGAQYKCDTKGKVFGTIALVVALLSGNSLLISGLLGEPAEVMVTDAIMLGVGLAGLATVHFLCEDLWD